jgi:hypothetical protein
MSLYQDVPGFTWIDIHTGAEQLAYRRGHVAPNFPVPSPIVISLIDYDPVVIDEAPRYNSYFRVDLLGRYFEHREKDPEDG